MAIVKCEREGRPSAFGVRWVEGGKRKFKYFKTVTARNEFFAKMVKAERQKGRAILEISANDAVIMRSCVEMLGDAESVLLACREYAGKTKLVECAVDKAIKMYLDEKRQLGRDENYHRAMRNILAKVAARFPASFAEWDAELARAWSLELIAAYAPITVMNHLKWSSAFCNWAIQRGFLRENVFANVAIPDVIMPEPEFLAVEDMRSLMEVAVERYPDTVAYFAIGAFAGVRSSATARLGIEAFDFDKRGILILAHQAKNKRRIYLDGYEPNLWRWLEWARKYAPEGFKLTKRQWDAKRPKVAELAGVAMPKNCLRHSFCTYHVALHGDAGKTATLLTHRGNVSILYENYRGNASREDAVKWFGIEP